MISRAKNYAKNRNMSLSRMIESYLDAITKSGDSDVEITSLVKSLSGVIDLPHDFDYKKDRADHLNKKHS